jgi:flagellar hook-basal body complex protein FliE
MSININSFVPDSKLFDNIKLGTSTNETSGADKSNQGSFLDMLKSKMDDVNDLQIASDNNTQAFVKGDPNVNIDQVMLSGEEAKQSLQLAIEVRNKLIDAFQELNKTQI